MKSTFRKILFWMHLCAGVAAGIVIGIMSLTGASLAFEPQILDWADREVRQAQAPAPGAPQLPIDELLAKVRAARPGTPPAAVTVDSEPNSAVLVSLGRTSSVYVNPYTGELREPGSPGLRAFFHQMEEWHRWLGTSEEHRAMGRAITGASNAVFLFLAISGLYLWWPRKWTWRTVRPVLWFKSGLKGKARDFNWHNTAGFWALPVILVLTVSGMVMSYRWASDLVFTLTGNEPPANQGPFAQPTVKVPQPPPGASPLGYDALFAEARKQVPGWENITLRLGGGPRGNAPQGPRPDGSGRPEPRGPQALTFSIKEKGAWPFFASAQATLDPFTGQVLRRETFADYNSGRQLRSWLRFLHTGEALGWVGQLIACLSSLGGAFLMWTGFTLAWRRFFRRGGRVASAESSTPTVQPETTT